MAHKEYEKGLSFSIGGKTYPAKIITALETVQGKLKKFKKQFLVQFDSEWEEIRRCDTAHGKLHIHKFKLNAPPEIEQLTAEDFNTLIKEQSIIFDDNAEKWLIIYLLKK